MDSEGAKVVLVTGASSGIGKEIARKSLKDGYRVYGAARRIVRMKDLEEPGATVMRMDITKEEDILGVVERIKSEAGGVDILVNNAGFGSYGAMEDTNPEDARYQFEVNLFGPARLTQLLLPGMRQKRFGKIINISSMAGKTYMPLGSWYHASKYALEGWSDCLRLELAPFGIDVIIIEPGIIATEFGDVFRGPLLKRSGNSAYAYVANSFAAAAENSYKEGNGSPPSVIADVVSKAIKAKKPKPRYAAGKFARPLIFMHKWLGDRVYDKMVRRAI